VFSHEYGVLAFRLISAALALLMLERTAGILSADGPSKQAQLQLDLEETQYGPLPCFSAMLQMEMQRSDSLDSLDSILGWSESTADPYPEIILSRTVAATLLDVISQDNTGFLKTFMTVYPICMDAILFFLWRHVIHQSNILEDGSTANIAVSSFGQIVWKYFLISPPRHFYLIQAAISDMEARTRYTWKHPGYRNLEDSKTVIGAFIRRFRPPTTNSNKHTTSIHSATFVHLQMFMLTFLQPGIEDLIPFIFQSIIAQLWTALRSDFELENVNLFVENVTSTFGTFGMLLDQCDDANGSPHLVRIVEEIASNDLLDFIQSTFFLLEVPTSKATHAELGLLIDKNKGIGFVRATYALVGKLAKKIPKEVLGTIFRDYALDWYKCEQHMACYFDPTNTDPDTRNDRSSSLATIVDAQPLGRGETSDASNRVFSAAKPGIVVTDVKQHGKLIQMSSDWLHHFERPSHRALCRGYVKPITDGELALTLILKNSKFKNLDPNHVVPVYEKHNGDLSKVIPELTKLAKLPKPDLV
ncbi:hypothetical protein FRC11_013761, partial [Ceratobasidium sp. 423]